MGNMAKHANLRRPNSRMRDFAFLQICPWKLATKRQKFKQEKMSRPIGGATSSEVLNKHPITYPRSNTQIRSGNGTVTEWRDSKVRMAIGIVILWSILTMALVHFVRIRAASQDSKLRGP